jgi:hypothetical protein
MSQPAPDLEWLAADQTMCPRRSDASNILRVKKISNVEDLACVALDASELVPLPIEVVVSPVSSGRPDHLWHRVQNRSESLLNLVRLTDGKRCTTAIAMRLEQVDRGRVGSMGGPIATGQQVSHEEHC